MSTTLNPNPSEQSITYVGHTVVEVELKPTKKEFNFLTLKNMIKEFFTSVLFKRFLWQTAGAFVGLVAVYLTGINFLYAPLVIALCQGISKELNNRAILFKNPARENQEIGDEESLD